MADHRKPRKGHNSNKPDSKEPDQALVRLLLMVLLKVVDWLWTSWTT